LEGGYADLTVPFGAPGAGWIPIAGDWNGDRVDTIGLYDPTTSGFYLRDSNTAGVATLMFGFGAPGNWKPVVGDWDADGIDTVGLYAPAESCFYLRNQNSAGYADIQFGFGQPGAQWTPLAGKWSGGIVAESMTTASTTTNTAAENTAILDPVAVDQIDLAAMVALELSKTADDSTDELLEPALSS
jgi:hypothetical protein